jgi:steroid delta-isomerase
MMSEEHPALAAARNSWRCVMTKKKEEWLGLMSEDVCVEDPIGVAATNPTGKGFVGKQALSEFYDQNIANNELHIEAHESYAVGNESAHVLTLSNKFPNGVKIVVHGIFTYRLNDGGKIQSLRGYWSMDQAEITQPS